MIDPADTRAVLTGVLARATERSDFASSSKEL